VCVVRWRSSLRTGARCRMSHGVCHRDFTGSSPAVGAVPTKLRVFHRRPCSPAGNYQPAAAYEDRILLRADRRRCELIAGARVFETGAGFGKNMGRPRTGSPANSDFPDDAIWQQVADEASVPSGNVPQLRLQARQPLKFTGGCMSAEPTSRRWGGALRQATTPRLFRRL
jgi:hypothetical protein